MFVQFSRKIQHPRRSQPLEIRGLEVRKCQHRRFRIVHEEPDQALFRLGDLTEARQLARRERCLLLCNSPSNLTADNILGDTRLVCQPVREPISQRSVWNPSRYRQHLVEKFHSTFVGVEVLPRRGAVEQVLQIRLRLPNPFTVGPASVPPDERIRVLARRQDRHVDVKAFCDKHFARFRRGALAGGVRVVAQHDLADESPQLLRLLWRERGPARRHYPLRASLIHLSEVEIALNQDRDPSLTHRVLGEVQPVERPPLRIDRRFRRVQVLGLLIGINGASAEGDDRSGIPADRNHQPVPEPVDGRPVLALRQQAGP